MTTLPYSAVSTVPVLNIVVARRRALHMYSIILYAHYTKILSRIFSNNIMGSNRFQLNTYVIINNMIALYCCIEIWVRNRERLFLHLEIYL